MRVLVVDDDAAVRLRVRRGLEREGLDVIEACNALEALRSTAAKPVDVAVLDHHLPGRCGVELLSRLRRHHTHPHVIMLTGSASQAGRLRSHSSAADDYMVKPVSVRELTARVLAAGRRRAPGRSPPTIDAGGLRIDTSARTVTIGNEPVDLSRREFELLLHLALHPGRMFTRAELLQAAWHSSAEWQSEATVTEHVRRLRKKTELDPASPVRIVTVRGAGYRFDVTPNAPALVPIASSDQLAGSGAERSRDATVVVVGNVVVYASAATLTLVGAHDLSDVVGRDVLDFVAPQSLGASQARQESATHGRWPRPEVITLVRLDGGERLVEVASAPVLWDGAPASQITLWDVSSDSSKLRELATGIRTEVSEAIIIADARLRIQSFNPAAEELYGWREDEVIGRVTTDIVPWLRDDITEEMARDVFQRHGRWHGVIVQGRRDGSTVTVRSSATLLRDRGGQPVGVICVNRPIEQHAMQQSTGQPVGNGALVDEIRRGLERAEFTVHYQPVVELSNGRWRGVEALLRWQHPERGLLPPAAFVDAAERSGAIVDLGEVALNEACRQWAAWQRAGIDLQMAVNLSGRQLADPHLADRLADAMSAVSMRPGALWLEVTETSLVDDLDQATRALRRLVDQGARVSIDDFGTGWASLTYLREFPVHALKIDRVFVNGLGKDSADNAIVSSIISLGRELELSVVAEGIETAEQLAHLRQLGCELGQGFLFGRPQAPEDLAALRSRG
jgi:PAS domain S-box-containing protein